MRPVPAVGEKSRLGRADWVMAGFRALATGGPEAVRVEPVARSLGATKGSFYWHFRDLQALHAAMLEAWETLATTEITAAARRPGAGPRDQVMLLVEMISTVPETEAGMPPIEPAIRDWGRVDPMAREVLVRVDRQRLDDLREFLVATGLHVSDAERGAEAFYAAVIGLESLRMTTGISMRDPLRAVAEAALNGTV